MEICHYGESQKLHFVNEFLTLVTLVFANLLMNKESFVHKLERLTFVVLETKNGTNGVCSCMRNGDILIFLEINPEDSKKYIAFVCAHELAHCLFACDNHEREEKAVDGSVSVTAVERVLPSGKRYGFCLEELVADYIAKYTVSKLDCSDETGHYAQFDRETMEKQEIVHMIENAFGKSLFNLEHIDGNCSGNDNNLFWKSIVTCQLNDVINLYDNYMGKGAFQELYLHIENFFKYQDFSEFQRIQELLDEFRKRQIKN